MTETEKKALALVAQLQEEDDGRKYSYAYHFEALCRAIEQHEAFRQEVSDAVHKHWGYMPCEFDRFIIPKPVDPLVEAIADYKRTKGTGEYATNKDMADALRAALAARGLEIREKQP